MTYNSLQGIFTSMIGFVTWSPYKGWIVQKGGQVTKPIIVKMHCILLYVIQVKGVKMFNYLASKFLVTKIIVVLTGLAFFTARL